MRPQVIPTQEVLDAVAHFHEAASELRESRMFAKGAESLRIKWEGDYSPEKAIVTLPNEEWIKASLMPFRKMWLSSDRTNYKAILKKMNVL